MRRNLGLESGSRVDFVLTDAGTYELVPATGTVRSLRGCVARPARPVTIEEMDEAIAEAATEVASR